MLKPDERLYFIHIPKTAGTTLIPLIDLHFDEREICPAQLWREFVHLPQESLSKYRLFRGHFGGNGLHSFLSQPPVCMTMLREPVDLAVSTYEFIRREPATRVHRLVRDRNMSLGDFFDCRETRSKASDKQTRHLSFDLEYDPDTGPIFHSAESLAVIDGWVREHRRRIEPCERLERAKQKIESCRFFGLVERFDESMALMCYTFGWHPIARVQKLRVAPGRSEDELSPELADRVRQFNQLDLELYEFAKQLFERRLEAMYDDLARFIPQATEQESQKHGDEAAADAAASNSEPGTRNGTLDSVDVMHLLDLHYAERYTRRRGPVRERIRVNFDERLDGDGWHRREDSALDGSTFRWTGPGLISTIDLPLKAETDLRLTLCIINVLKESILAGLEVRMNGEWIQLEMIAHKSRGRVLQGVIPRWAVADSLPPFSRLELRIPHTVQPCIIEPRSDDSREVGLAVNWIDLAPVEVTAAGAMPVEAIDDDERLRRKERRRRAVITTVKQRVAGIPIVGPRLKDAYVRFKNR